MDGEPLVTIILKAIKCKALVPCDIIQAKMDNSSCGCIDTHVSSDFYTQSLEISLGVFVRLANFGM